MSHLARHLATTLFALAGLSLLQPLNAADAQFVTAGETVELPSVSDYEPGKARGRAAPVFTPSPTPAIVSASNAAELIDLGTYRRPAAADVIDPEPDQTDARSVDLPHALIAADGEAAPGCWLRLDGTASYNPKNGRLQYEWKQRSGPRLVFTAQDGSNAKVWAFFTQPGEYGIELRVRNSAGWSIPQGVRLHVRPRPAALSVLDARKVVGAGERVALPGEGWRQITGPALDLRNDAGETSFRALQGGFFVFEAPRAGDVPERRAVIVPNGKDAALGDRRPLATLPKNLSGRAHEPLLIDGSLSRDPDGEEQTAALQARWNTPEIYRGMKLEPLPGLKARFTAPKAGTYAVQLIVSDGQLESEPAETVYITIAAAAPPPADLSAGVTWDDIPEMSDDVRFRRVTLGLWGNLDRAVQLFPSRCGAALRVDGDVATPENFHKIPLALEIQNGSLLHLVDWIARQSDARYRREGNQSFWLTRPLSWLKNEKLEAIAVQADALHAKPDGSDLMALLAPCFRRLLEAKPGATLGFEATRQEVQAVLPLSACARLKELCHVLRVPEGFGLPPAEPMTMAEFLLRKALADKRVTLAPGPRRVDYLLRELSESSGIPIAMDWRQFGAELPRVELGFNNVPLRDALRTVVDAAGFDGCAIEFPGGLWLYKGAMPYPSGELLWDHTTVRAYDISRLAAALSENGGGLATPLSGEAIAHAVRRRVYPDSWHEPGAGIFFHPSTGKLVVMHGPAAHRRVLDFLHDLTDRGEAALGPVEEK